MLMWDFLVWESQLRNSYSFELSYVACTPMEPSAVAAEFEADGTLWARDAHALLDTGHTIKLF